MTKLDLVVASEMRPHADLLARLEEFSLSPDDLQRAREHAIAAGVMNRPYIRPHELIAYFGQPAFLEPERLGWDLALWPDHWFEFGLHAGGWVTHDGFATKRDSRTHLAERLELTTALVVLKPGCQTSAEIQATLGLPDTLHGWERMEDWFYRLPDRDEHLALEFDFRLLTGAGYRNPIRM